MWQQRYRSISAAGARVAAKQLRVAAAIDRRDRQTDRQTDSRTDTVLYYRCSRLEPGGVSNYQLLIGTVRTVCGADSL